MTVATASVKNGWKISRRLTGRFILWQFIIWVAIKGSDSSIALGVERNCLRSQRRRMMVRSTTVHCKVCGKKLAFWDMFMNIQHEDEYECFGEFRRKAENVFVDKEGNKCHSFTMDGGAGTIMDSPKPGMKRVKYEMLPCSLYYNTKYCKSCVRKIKYKCVRPRCKGPIRIVRRKDGKPTRYGHGGY